MNWLRPTNTIDKIEHISIDQIQKKQYTTIILDYHNTLVSYYDAKISMPKMEWINQLKQNHIKVYLLTNSFSKKQIVPVAQTLQIPYHLKSCKPFPFSLLKILKKEKVKKKQVLVIGDHLLTDILMANVLNIDSILVDPLQTKEKFHSKIVRKIENLLLSHTKKA